MTYCVGIKVRDGLIGLADGRVTSGNQVSSARKLTLHGPSGAQFMMMNSGLRSLRDKTVAYVEQEMKQNEERRFSSILDVVTIYCACLRRVKSEDQAVLESHHLPFNVYAIIGGQLSEDDEPQLYLVYPEGNWIVLDERTPYLSIGSTSYGKPILDRALRYETDLQSALKITYLSFDSTRYSAADVGYPVDLATWSIHDRTWRTVSYEHEDLIEQRQWWNRHITDLASRLPDGPWVDELLSPRNRQH